MRCECLRGDDEERFGGIQTFDSFGDIRPIDIRDEHESSISVAVVLERFVCHDRSEIRSADSDIYDVANRLTGVTFPRIVSNRFAELLHAIEDLVNIGNDALAIDKDDCIATCSQSRMQHSAVFGDVDRLAAKHRFDRFFQSRLVRKVEEQAQDGIIDSILRVV